MKVKTLNSVGCPMTGAIAVFPRIALVLGSERAEIASSEDRVVFASVVALGTDMDVIGVELFPAMTAKEDVAVDELLLEFVFAPKTGFLLSFGAELLKKVVHFLLCSDSVHCLDVLCW